jgi:putative flippase GtrA
MLINKLPFYKLWENMHPKTKRQLVLFLFVGMVNASFGYSTFSLFIYLGYHYTVAVLFSTCLGVLFSFNTTGRIVFKHFHINLFLKYIGVYVFLYFFNVSLLQFLQLFSKNYYLTGFITIIPCALMAFILNKFVVFKKGSEPLES